MTEQCAPGKDSFIFMVYLVMEVMDNPDCTLLCTVQGVAGKHFLTDLASFNLSRLLDTI